MKNYRVMVNGTGFELVVDGVTGLYGFNTPRFVQARTEGEARALALSEVTEKLNGYPNSEEVGSVSVESVSEWTAVATKPGLTWYKQMTD